MECLGLGSLVATVNCYLFVVSSKRSGFFAGYIFVCCGCIYALYVGVNPFRFKRVLGSLVGSGFGLEHSRKAIQVGWIDIGALWSTIFCNLSFLVIEKGTKALATSHAS